MRSLKALLVIITIFPLLVFWPVTLAILRLEWLELYTEVDFILIYFLPIGVGALGLLYLRFRKREKP